MLRSQVGKSRCVYKFIIASEFLFNAALTVSSVARYLFFANYSRRIKEVKRRISPLSSTLVGCVDTAAHLHSVLGSEMHQAPFSIKTVG